MTTTISTAVTFQLSEADYRQIEAPNAMMQIEILKSSAVILANSVTFMVNPLTVEEAVAQGVITQFEAQDILPNKAG